MKSFIITFKIKIAHLPGHNEYHANEMSVYHCKKDQWQKTPKKIYTTSLTSGSSDNFISRAKEPVSLTLETVVPTSLIKILYFIFCVEILWVNDSLRLFSYPTPGTYNIEICHHLMLSASCNSFYFIHGLYFSLYYGWGF